MAQQTNDRRVALDLLVQQAADTLADKYRWWSIDNEGNDTNDLRRAVASAMNTHGLDSDRIPSILSCVEQAIVSGDITPRSTANGLPARTADDVISGGSIFRSVSDGSGLPDYQLSDLSLWYLTIADADALLQRLGLPTRYTADAVAAAGGMFAEEVAFSLSQQPTANKDIEWHLQDIQAGFEHGELAFYKDDVPQRSEDWITPYAQYSAHFTGDSPKVSLLSKTSLFTKPNDVNEWLEKRGVGYRLPVILAERDKPAQAGNDAEKKAPKLRSQAQDEEILALLKTNGYDPLALPPNKCGRPGVRAETKTALGSGGMWSGATVFDKAWERLTRNGDIAYKK